MREELIKEVTKRFYADGDCQGLDDRWYGNVSPNQVMRTMPIECLVNFEKATRGFTSYYDTLDKLDECAHFKPFMTEINGKTVMLNDYFGCYEITDNAGIVYYDQDIDFEESDEIIRDILFDEMPIEIQQYLVKSKVVAVTLWAALYNEMDKNGVLYSVSNELAIKIMDFINRWYESNNYEPLLNMAILSSIFSIKNDNFMFMSDTVQCLVRDMEDTQCMAEYVMDSKSIHVKTNIGNVKVSLDGFMRRNWKLYIPVFVQDLCRDVLVRFAFSSVGVKSYNYRALVQTDSKLISFDIPKNGIKRVGLPIVAQ